MSRTEQDWEEARQLAIRIRWHYRKMMDFACHAPPNFEQFESLLEESMAADNPRERELNELIGSLTLDWHLEEK